MKFKAEIDVMPLDALLDPQGKAVSSSMGNVIVMNITDSLVWFIHIVVANGQEGL